MKNIALIFICCSILFADFMSLGGSYENSSQSASWTLLFHGDSSLCDWFIPAIEIGFNFNKFNSGKGDKFLFFGPEIIRFFDGQLQFGCYVQGYTVKVKQKNNNMGAKTNNEYEEVDSPVLSSIYPWIGSTLQVNDFRILLRTYFNYNDYTLMFGVPVSF